MADNPKLLPLKKKKNTATAMEGFFPIGHFYSNHVACSNLANTGVPDDIYIKVPLHSGQTEGLCSSGSCYLHRLVGLKMEQYRDEW